MIIKCKKFIRLIKREPGCIHTLFSLISGKNRIILIGTPIHGNLGDHLIAHAETAFFDRYVPGKKAIDCSMNFSKSMMKFMKKCIKPDDILVISGGGWLGTEWRNNEEFVRDVIESFPENRIIIFPQTAYYRDDDIYLNEAVDIYRKHDKLYFCARDYLTYELVRDNAMVDEDRLLYMPDMALYDVLHEEMKPVNRDHIGLCLRDDREISISEGERDHIVKSVETRDKDYLKIYTSEAGKRIQPKDRKENVLRKLYEIAGLKVLVTDRLHAMIMAAITDTPCIVFDNTTHKVKGVYEWIKELDHIQFCESGENIDEALEMMLSKRFETTFNDWNKEEYLDRLSKWLKG